MDVEIICNTSLQKSVQERLHGSKCKSMLGKCFNMSLRSYTGDFFKATAQSCQQLMYLTLKKSQLKTAVMSSLLYSRPKKAFL